MGTRGSDSEEKLKEQFLKEEILDENEVPIEEKKNLKLFASIVKKIIILNKTRKVVEISKLLVYLSLILCLIFLFRISS